MRLREVRIQLDLLGLQQKAEEGVHCLSVSQKDTLWATLEVSGISVNEFESLPVIDLADVGINIPPAEDKYQGFEFCDLLA